MGFEALFNAPCVPAPLKQSLNSQQFKDMPGASG
jgi:hypothetical protein